MWIFLFERGKDFDFDKGALTRVDLLEGAAEPDVVQAAGALGAAGADVGELAGRYQGTQLLLPQDVQVGALRSTAKISQHHQLFFHCRVQDGGKQQDEDD